MRVFDNDMGIVAVRFLEMCLCSSGTAAAYFEKVRVFSTINQYLGIIVLPSLSTMPLLMLGDVTLSKLGWKKKIQQCTLLAAPVISFTMVHMLLQSSLKLPVGLIWKKYVLMYFTTLTTRPKEKVN